MATKVEDLGQSEEITVFSGSSEHDIAYAKTFWQSMELLPPLESRLVSSNIRQRLKVAPPGHQGVNVLHTQQEESQELEYFLAKAHALQKADEAKRLQTFVKLREEDLKLLQKHRRERQEKEAIANHKGLRQNKSLSSDIPKDQYDNHEEFRQSMKDIEKFDKRIDNSDFDSDTD